MDLPKVVVTSRVHEDVLDLLSASCRLATNRTEEPWSPEEVLDHARDAAGLLACMNDRIDRAFLARCPQLRIVAGVLKGFDNFDLDACSAAGVWLSVVPDRLTAATAELTVGLMIGLSRNLLAGDNKVRQGHSGWRPTLYGRGLDGSTVGLLGFGAIGQAVARRLHPFGCELLYFDERKETIAAAHFLGAHSVSLDELLGAADFVVVALPLTVRTQHLIDADRLRRFKPGACLVNTARGSIVDEVAVAHALEAGHLGGYAADVFEMEDLSRPDRPASVARGLIENRARTLLTPHIGSADGRARRLAELEMARSILDLLAGRVPRGAVNHPRNKLLASAC